MTGFASATRESDAATITVTIRAVNHRHLDLQLRVPQTLAEAEGRIRASVQRRIGRGRVELAVNVQYRHTASVEVEFNESLAVALSAALETARSRGIVQGPLTPGDLLRLPQALAVRERPVERDAAMVAQLIEMLEGAVEEALTQLDAMRSTEGDHLNADLEVRRALLGGMLEEISRCGRSGPPRAAGAPGGSRAGAHGGGCGRCQPDRAGDRAGRLALRHQRGDGAVSRASCALEAHWRTRRSPAAESWIFCCRK